MRTLRSSLAAVLLGVALASPPSVWGGIQEVGAVVLSVGNLDREAGFFVDVLGFRKLEMSSVESGSELAHLTAVSGARARRQRLKLGEEEVQLVQFLEPRGRSIPADSRSIDHWFQHIAIVVSDLERAYTVLRSHRVKHVSTAPQTLPAWNPDAGGIKAFYFRDPEDHVLELIWFPPGKGDPRWQQPSTNLFLGIDHTAIVVADTDRSLVFYRDQLGLRQAGAAENWGTEQEHLNQVFGARLRITALRAPRGPGIELLEYLTPPGGRPRASDAHVGDLLSWRTVLHEPGAGEPKLIPDPDGHLLEVRK